MTKSHACLSMQWNGRGRTATVACSWCEVIGLGRVERWRRRALLSEWRRREREQDSQCWTIVHSCVRQFLWKVEADGQKKRKKDESGWGRGQRGRRKSNSPALKDKVGNSWRLSRRCVNVPFRPMSFSGGQLLTFFWGHLAAISRNFKKWQNCQIALKQTKCGETLHLRSS